MKSEEKQQRHEKWRKIIEEYLQSGMTQKMFCEQRGLNLPQFVYYYSQHKIEKAAAPKAAAFLPVKVANQDKTAGICEIKLSLPNGFQCSFPSYTDPAQLKQLVVAILSC